MLFDLDGTLTHPAVGITRCVAHALQELGHPPLPHEELLRFIGPPLHGTFAALGLDPLAAVAAYRDRFASTGIFENDLVPGMVDVLEALSGTPLAIASSKPEVFVRRIADHFGIAHHFVEQVGAELDGSRTDKAEVVGEALRRLGLAGGADVVLVGDRVHDVDGALAHGLTAIGVAWGYAGPGELVGVAVAATPADLLALIV